MESSPYRRLDRYFSTAHIWRAAVSRRGLTGVCVMRNFMAEELEIKDLWARDKSSQRP